MKDEIAYSAVVPVFNEEKNLSKLYSQLKKVLDDLGKAYEIIIIDDGSTDDSFEVLSQLHKKDKKVKVIRFKRNFGQTAAISAGFKFARGKLIITLDADLQNDPLDIPKLLVKINEGYDLVCGWRKNRHDSFLTRKVPSEIANRIIYFFTKVGIHDSGCTLKIYKQEVVKNLNLYGEMHRLIPALACWMGAKITEVPVRHHARKFGHSKYGLSRTIKVMLDLVTIKFLVGYQTKPSYLFGGAGFLLLFASLIFGLVTGWQKIYQDVWVHRNPLFTLMVFSSILGVQFIMMGLLAEIMVRTYHESQQKPTYYIDRILK